jgi:outer membrane protein OmpU
MDRILVSRHGWAQGADRGAACDDVDLGRVGPEAPGDLSEASFQAMKRDSRETKVMKKVLLGTTAIVAAGMIASAPSAIAAEKLKLGVGGYMEQWFGYTNNDDAAGQDFSGFDVKSDSEIHFKGSTTLDNGISVGVNVQLEANSNSGDQIDESYLIVKGGFGEINLGSENSAMYKMHYAPADFGIGIITGDQTGWLSTTTNAAGASISEGGYFRAPFGSTYVEPLRSNDTEKLTYYTPRVEGFQLGLSYSPESGGSQDNIAQPNRDTAATDLVMAGVNFNRSFGSTNVRASLGYGTVLDGVAGTNTEASAFNAGLGLGFGGFGVGVSYASYDDSGANDGSGLNAGVSYSSGPWGVSLGYFHGEKDGATTAGSLAGDGEQDTFQLSAKYALGPGITAAGSLAHSKFKSDDTLLAGTDSAEVEATYAVVGLRVSF